MNTLGTNAGRHRASVLSALREDVAGQNSSPHLASPTLNPLGPRHLAALWMCEEGQGGGRRWEAWRREGRGWLWEGLGWWWQRIRLETPRRKKCCAASRSLLSVAIHLRILLHIINLLLHHIMFPFLLYSRKPATCLLQWQICLYFWYNLVNFKIIIITIAR